MTQAIDFRPLPPREAIAYFRSKGLAPENQRFDWRDTWREEHARMFVVAKAMQDDVLEAIRASLDRALAEGRTLDQFIEELQPELQRLGWWGQQRMTDPQTGESEIRQLGSRRRLRTIFDTNMRTSYAAGRWARIQRVKSAFPYLEYRQIQRPSRRDEHAVYHGLVFSVDDPIWERIFPPNGWFCGCSVRQLTRSQFQREGKTLSRGEDVVQDAPFTNPRTGEVSDLPAGVHPGFDSNPGVAWVGWQERTRRAAASVGIDDGRLGALRAMLQESWNRSTRRQIEHGAVFDLDAAIDPVSDTWSPIFTGDGTRNTFAPPRELEPLLRDRDRRLGIVHTHWDGTLFSHADLRYAEAREGLEALFVVGADGTVMSLSVQPGSTQAYNTALETIAPRLSTALHRRAIVLNRPDVQALWQHLALDFLRRRDLVRYGIGPSDRLSSVLRVVNFADLDLDTF